MGNYGSNGGSRGNRFSGRSDRRFGGGGFGNRSEGRGGYGRDRDSRRQGRRPPEMHDVICDKCKKECQVPFRPSGDKPVLCSDCFKRGNGSNKSFNSRSTGESSGISLEQFNTLNKKLDKIISVLQELEMDEGHEDDEEETEEESEKKENDKEEKEAKVEKKKEKKAKSK